MIKNVKTNLAPLFLLWYFLFAQVYPFFHFHLHQENGKYVLELAFHPAQACEFDHKTDEKHHHEGCDHVRGDWEHTLQKIDSSKKSYSSDFVEPAGIKFYYYPCISGISTDSFFAPCELQSASVSNRAPPIC